MPTAAEKALIARRRAEERGGMLVPLLERLHEQEIQCDDQLDFRFMNMLFYARALPRRPGVFSPSSLGSCMRQSYFMKLGEKKTIVPNAQRSGYFLTGNFVHAQWQFATWKAHRAGMLELARIPIGNEVSVVMQLVIDKKITEEAGREWMEALNLYGDAYRPAIEYRVVDGDVGGTIDALVHFTTQETSFNTTVVDYKGINLIDYQRTVKNGAKVEYRRQVVGYARLVNALIDRGELPESWRGKNALLVSACKAGPVSGQSPIALHETIVPVHEFDGEVARRLRTLRFHVEEGEMPAAECVSTNHMAFQECSYNARCLTEVKAVQVERERRARKNTKPATPARSRRSE